MPRLARLTCCCVLAWLAWQFPASSLAELAPAPSSLRTCVVCHGVGMMGNRLVDAPRLSGMPSWYLSRQLEAFRKGWRGLHHQDLTGMEMRPQALAMTQEQMSDTLEYVASLPVGSSQATLEGDAERGGKLYVSCSACHGADGRGIESLHTPPLVGQNDWYLLRQLQYFKSGVRGTGDGDIQGAVMRASAAVLADDQAMADVIAYIGSLQSD